MRRLHEHNHDSNAAAVEVAKVTTAIKRRAEDTMEVRCISFLLEYVYHATRNWMQRPAQIITQEVQGLGLAAMALPSNDALRKCIQRKRNQLHAAPPAPRSVATLVIPPEYQTYSLLPGQG